jgi:hypothetical protein
MKYSFVFVLASLTLALLPLPAQIEEEEAHDHERELGLSISHVKLKAEKESAPAVHLHLLKRLDGSEFLERLGIGLGFETIFADHTHHTLMATVTFFPIEHLAISLSPGIVWADEEDGWENHYATHLEASYGFEVGEYEVGPVIGYADSDEGDHYMFGLHFGIPF